MAENISARSCRALFLSLLLLGMLVPRVMMGQPNVRGQWSTLPNPVPINPIHVALLPNGKVLIVAGSGNLPGQSAPYSSGAAVYSPPGTFNTLPVSWDMFCNGMVLLHDGRAFIDGGTIQYDPFQGSPRTSIFDPGPGPATNTFTDAQDMADGRWYPTVTTLGDGRVMTFSGLNESGGTNRAVEIYTVGSGWSQEYVANWTPPLYPWMHLLPTGKVFYSGPGVTSRLFTPPPTASWTTVATTKYGGQRSYGSSVLLPLTPANNYRPKVMILGGNNPATATTEIIDLGAATPTWQFGPNMSQPRVQMNAVILPNGKVVTMGGSSNDEVLSTSSLNADLYDPATNTFSSADANAIGRLYHSVALLLPDATVWLAGGNPDRGTYEQRMEIYKPAYLFQAGTRPSISSAPSSISWGNPFTVQTPDAANIASVVLVRNGAATHAFNMDQRLVGMSFTAGTGLTVTAPPNGNIAPPGYYMLFILNTSGVPSVASFVRLTQAAPSPDFSLSATPSSRSVAPGGSTTYAVTVTPSGGFNGTVSFSASGLPAGASASFNPTTVSGSGSTTMTVTTASSTPLGSYTLTITGTSGSLIRTTTVTLTVGTNLALGKPAVASSVEGAQYPASAAVDGNLTTRWSSQYSDPQWIYVDLGATYNINRVKLVWEAAYGKSFKIQVSPDATNWTDIFSTTTNTALTNDLTLAGTGRYVRMYGLTRGTPYGYSLYEMEVYGTQAAQSPDFSLSATPNTRSVAPGGSTTYTVTVTPSGGFSGTVGFTASGLPAGASASFNPTTVSGSGSTTMTVTTASSTPAGSYTLTITGSSGSLSHTSTVTVTVTSGGATGNLALGKPAVASSVEGAQYPASAAVDGNLTTRWSSQYSDPQWIYVDLGATYNINRVKLVWEAAYGRSFKIQVSPDATNWTDIFSTTTNPGGTNDLTGLAGTGRYVRMYGLTRGTPYGYSLYEMEVYGSQGTSPINLALGKPVVPSSVEGAQYPASAAVDGNLTTRWSSQYSDPQWIYVDLGATYNINRVKLVWEAAYGRSFKIQVSPDATNWTDIFSTTTNTALTNDLTLAGTGRYVRMYGLTRGTPYGYSLYEMEVYGG